MPARFYRGAFASVLVAAALLLSGCVYLRLLTLKNQLGSFEKNFAIESTDGILLICKDPVLLGDDLRWLGVEPKSIKKAADAETWHARWVKEPPAGVKEAVEYDVELFARLADRRVQSVQIPERYFEFFSKQLFLNLLRSTGAAQIDRDSRKAEVKTAETPETKATRPQFADIRKMLGAATEQTEENGQIRCMYRYRPDSPNGKGKPIEVTFGFDAASGELRRLTGKLPKGTVSFAL